jgi:hypothetical protein
MGGADLDQAKTTIYFITSRPALLNRRNNVRTSVINDACTFLRLRLRFRFGVEPDSPDSLDMEQKHQFLDRLSQCCIL